MKITIITIAAILLFTAGWLASEQYHSVGKVTVTSVATDERGYISVKFIQDGQEFALDYLTQAEFNDLIK